MSKRKIGFGIFAFLIALSLSYIDPNDILLRVSVFYIGTLMILVELFSVFRNLGDEQYFHDWDRSIPAEISIFNQTAVKLSSNDFICSPYHSIEVEHRKMLAVYLSGVITTAYVLVLTLLGSLNIIDLITSVVVLGIISKLLDQYVVNQSVSKPDNYFTISFDAEVSNYRIRSSDPDISILLTDAPHNYINIEKNFLKQSLLLRLFDQDLMFGKVPNDFLYIDLNDFDKNEVLLGEQENLRSDKIQVLTYYHTEKVYRLLYYWSKFVSGSTSSP